ncbi:aldo/keto reductase [Amycolatopsis benzoatilytica]|uniref:aldo/keto reductase n=1 Tax=Amycolatopsis benzoatilytica TaxID=346045 RepID=UPI000685F5A7|nr:aldo/keto reductase [Amycolatopsis benzoatilytica]
MPQLGLGTYRIADDVAQTVVATALDAGYRHFDLASYYRNERAVGLALRRSGIARSELFLTSKVWNDSHGYEHTVQAFERSLAEIETDYLDLYLIHWPASDPALTRDTWRALEDLARDGRARSIGVSNFSTSQLESLLRGTTIVPAVNQIELHPYLPQTELRELHRAQGIVTQAWAPLGRAAVLDDPVIADIARRHRTTTAQVVLRWHLQLGTVALPKSVTPQRIRANAQVHGFALDETDLARIASLDHGRHVGPTASEPK